jgi:hypothetical protein
MDDIPLPIQPVDGPLLTDHPMTLPPIHDSTANDDDIPFSSILEHPLFKHLNTIQSLFSIRRDMFWEIYNRKSQHGKRLLTSLLVNPPFVSYPFDRPPLSLPEEIGQIEHITSLHPDAVKQEICLFLQTYFCCRSSSTSLSVPRLSFTINSLFEHGERDHVFLLRHKTDGIIGTVRYHWNGYFMGGPSPPPTMYLVDALCIHPKWRGKQIVDYLLTELQKFANTNHIPNAIFLKEGASLKPLALMYYYTSQYVYRNLSSSRSKPSTSAIHKLTSQQAFFWIQIYLQLYPHTLFIGHPHSNNIKWLLYRNGPHRILTGIQNTHQIYPGTNETMGWITVWLETGPITNTIRKQASIDITNHLQGTYDWIWMDMVWAGEKEKSEEWMIDGNFYWHQYQWETNKVIDGSYGIMI